MTSATTNSPHSLQPADRQVVEAPDGIDIQASRLGGDGTLVNSGPLDGLDVAARQEA